MESLNTTFLPPKSQTPLGSLYLKLRERASPPRCTRLEPARTAAPRWRYKPAARSPCRAQHKTSTTEPPKWFSDEAMFCWKKIAKINPFYKERFSFNFLWGKELGSAAFIFTKNSKQTNPAPGFVFQNATFHTYCYLYIQNLTRINRDFFGNTNFFQLQSLVVVVLSKTSTFHPNLRQCKFSSFEKLSQDRE